MKPKARSLWLPALIRIGPRRATGADEATASRIAHQQHNKAHRLTGLSRFFQIHHQSRGKRKA
ncbi:MAG TPA: hypothetical protein VG734_09405 [Lacunisphaera sp.]|nr:hypothetical protein [Lacunisphaera sp.]